MHYDLIVCGAGPAGAIAALTAARAGLNVALIEKYPLPRRKTCGGGVPVLGNSLLQDLVPEAFVEADVTYLRHTWKFAEAVVAPINPGTLQRPLSIWMVQRSIFDQALVKKAVEAGVAMRDGLAVKSVQVEGDRVTVRARSFFVPESTRESEFVATANYAIGADGANGVTAQATGLRQKRLIAIAMELELPHEWGTGHPDLRPEVAHLEYGAVPHGYAWIFPKGEHLNIGAGVFSPRHADARRERKIPGQLKQAILDYVKAMQLPPPSEQLLFHAHPLPIWQGREPVNTADGRILLVGDAAGLINPFFGDGILHALKSGHIAAQAIVEDCSRDYSDRIHAEFGDSFDAALRLAQFFYQHTGICYRFGVKNERATVTAAQLLTGELQYHEIAGRVLDRLKSHLLG
ncbi:MAG: geranylgeranyl reductase family protein [Thermosynechococcaceae cyanobacterium]